MSRNGDLYNNDFYAWTQEQAALLREGAWHALDREHLIEEIESLGRSERKEVRSSLEGLVLHLLKWRYQSDYRGRGWRDNIEENRACIPECLQENPSLRPQLPTLLGECYPRARRQAARQTCLPLATLRPCPRRARGPSSRCSMRTSGRKRTARDSSSTGRIIDMIMVYDVTGG